jgi:hypothetical protein
LALDKNEGGFKDKSILSVFCTVFSERLKTKTPERPTVTATENFSQEFRYATPAHSLGCRRSRRNPESVAPPE